MRNGLAVLRQPQADYGRSHHRDLVNSLRVAGRDHFHHREGIKDDMPFVCLVQVDFSSEKYLLTGHLGGRDDNFSRATELVDIKFSVKINDAGKLVVSIDSTDRITSYEQSMKLILHSMNEMFKKKDQIGGEGGGGPGRFGFYPQSAMKTGRFATFKKWFDKAERELVLPPSMRESFINMNYNLVYVGAKVAAKKPQQS